MNKVTLDSRTVCRMAAALAGLAAVPALLAVLGMVLGSRCLAALGPDLVPMSPSGAVLMILLGGGMVVLEPRPLSTSRRRVAIGMALGVLVLCLVVVAGPVLGRILPHGRWAVLGRPTSLLTGLAAFIAAVSALTRWSSPEPRWRVRQVAALLAQVPLVIGTVVLVSYAAGAPLLYESGSTPMSLPSALCSAGFGLALMVAAGCDTWPLAVFGLVPREARHPQNHWFTTGPLALFLLLGVLVLSGGSFFLRGQLKATRTRVHAELSTIAEFKADQIGAWFGERRAAAGRLSHGALIQNNLRQYLAGSRQAPPGWQLQAWMEEFQKGTYRRVVLFDRQGRVRLSAPSGETFSAEDMDASELQAALQAKDVLMQDLHQHPGKPDIHLSLWIPVGAHPEPGSLAEGTLLLVMDPRKFLYPLVSYWPTVSSTAETLLVRREGGDVLYLSELRHRAHTAMSLREPLAAGSRLPSVLAARGQEGLVSGMDYRGEPVLAALHHVDGTPWGMVAKVDEAEVYGPLRRRVWVGGLGLIGVVAIVAAGLGMMVRHHDTEMIRKQLTLSQRFEWLMREANDIILLMDGEGRIQEANTLAVEHYGYPLAELQGMRVMDLRSPGTREEGHSQFAKMKAQGAIRFETVHRRKDGSDFPAEVSARLVDLEGQQMVVSFVRDITERQAQQRELQRMTQLYAALSQVNQAIVWTSSREELFAKLCEVLVEYGRFRMAWIGLDDPATHRVAVAAQQGDTMGYLDALEVRSDDTPTGHGAMGMAIREGCPCVLNDYLNLPESGAWREAAIRSGFASAAAFPIRHGGEVVGALAVYATEKDFFGTHEAELLMEAAMDVSFALDHLAGEERRREAEAALKESERLLREAQEAGGVGTYAWDIPGDRWTSSPFLDQIFGIGPDHPRTLDGWTAIIAPEARGQMLAYVAGIIGRRERFDQDYPIVRPSDGTRRWVRGRGELHWDAEGRPAALTGVIQDITEQKQDEESRRSLEAQLHQSQKLESLGSLAGGVAHDMNNVLGAILSMASTLRESPDQSIPSVQHLDTIIGACMRGRGVVKSLLYFAHKDLQEEHPIDLNGLVREIEQLLAYTTLKRVTLEMELQESLGFVRGDPGALSHALMNLCVNAVDAMPGGGTLHIQTEARTDGGVALRVRDTGEGMSPEVLERAVEPFFTTKPLGKGTGLGLSMVYATMQAHEGAFEIRSQVGHGTEAVLLFPASRVGQRLPAQEAPPVAAKPQNPLKILLVDDDELIRESMTSLLEMLGHEVTALPGGAAALRHLEAGLPADMVLLDMNMPGMTGAETLPRIKALRPELPVLMISGYSDQDIAPLIRRHPQVDGLQKPFSLKELQQKLAGLASTPTALANLPEG
jgi:PAS domain S-box-containing protein